MGDWKRSAILLEVAQISQQINQLRFKVKKERNESRRKMILAKLNELEKDRFDLKYYLRVKYNSPPPESHAASPTSLTTSSSLASLSIVTSLDRMTQLLSNSCNKEDNFLPVLYNFKQPQCLLKLISSIVKPLSIIPMNFISSVLGSLFAST